MAAKEALPITTSHQKRTAVKKAAEKKLPVRRSGGRPAKYDWAKLRTHFVEQTEPISLKDLAATYGTPYGMTRDRCSAERWQYLRAEHQANLAKEVTRQRIKTQLAEAENFDDQSLKNAKLGQTLIAGRMQQIAAVFGASQNNFNNALARLKAGQPVDKSELYSAIYAKELLELATALEKFQAVGRHALGTDFMNKDVLEEFQKEEGLDIGEEMVKGDLDRLAALWEAMERAGINDQFAIGNGDEGDDDIVDAEVVADAK